MNNNINNNEQFSENQDFNASNSSNFSKKKEKKEIDQNIFFSFVMWNIIFSSCSSNKLSNFSVCKKGLQGLHGSLDFQSVENFERFQKKKKAIQDIKDKKNKEDKKKLEDISIQYQDVIRPFNASRIDIHDIHEQYTKEIVFQASQETVQISELFCDSIYSVYEQAYYEIHESKESIEDECNVKRPLSQINPEMDKACNLTIYYRLQELKSVMKQKIRKTVEEY